jgi:A1 cistron-splicing factor AAR2
MSFDRQHSTMEAYGTTTTLVLLDMPSGVSITFDTLSFSSTLSFRGIKLIPEGLHLLTYGLDKSELGMRSGFFFLGKPGNVSAWNWDKNTEQLHQIQEQVERPALQERLQSLHPYLSPVPAQSDDVKTTWSDLTCYVTVDMLNRILPKGWMYTSQTSSTNDEATDQLSSLPSSKSEEILNFTSVNLKRTFNPHVVGRERTEQILDKSYYLGSLLKILPDELSLLGEFQLSFLTVLYMNNFSGFETWKNIFTMFCGCKAALIPRERLFRNFLTVLRHQFDMCSEETFNEVIVEGNFVTENLKVHRPLQTWDFANCFQSLNSSIEELNPKSSALRFSFAQLIQLLGAKFNWDPIYGPSQRKGGVGNDPGFYESGWDRDGGDYAPVVVDMPSDDDDETMDIDVDFRERWMNSGGRMDMNTGKMVFEGSPVP